MKYALLLIPVLVSGALFAQKNTVKTLDKTSFLREILGASYVKSDKAWTLPRTQAVLDTFEVEAHGGLYVAVDTIAIRDVGGDKEAWVLFTVEGYFFNFARLGKTPYGWTVKNMYYRLHEGAPGQYAPLAFYIQMIGSKSFIAIQEDWYASGVITTKWILYEPFSAKLAAEIDLARLGEKEQDPAQYTEISFLQIKYETVQPPLPDIMLTQNIESKKKGSYVQTSSRTQRYRWDARRAVFYKVGK